MEERNENYCGGHIKLCEDVSYIKATTEAIKKSIEVSTRLALFIILAMVSTVFWSGHTYNTVQDNKQEIENLRNEKRNHRLPDVSQGNERGQLQNS